MNENDLRKKISYQEPSILKTIKEAEFVRDIGNTVIQATTYESTRESTSINEYSIELQSSQQNLLSNIKNLEKVHEEIKKKANELDNSIKAVNKDFQEHEKLKNSELEIVNRDYANKLKSTEDEAKDKYKKENNLNKSEITHKEKETNKILSQANKEQEKSIKEAENTFNDTSKIINSEVLEARKELESSKQIKIKSLQDEFDSFLKENDNLEKDLSKNESKLLKSELLDLNNKISKRKIELKTREAELNEQIMLLEENFSKMKVEKDDWAKLQLSNASKTFEDFKNTKISKVKDIKSDETDKFAKLKDMRSTSIGVLRSEQIKIYKAIEAEKDNNVFKKEKEVKSSINEKEIATTNMIATLRVNFELERKNMLEMANKSLIRSNIELNNAIEKYYTFFIDNESPVSVLINS